MGQKVSTERGKLTDASRFGITVLHPNSDASCKVHCYLTYHEKRKKKNNKQPRWSIDPTPSRGTKGPHLQCHGSRGQIPPDRSKGTLGLVLALGEGQETKRFPEKLNHTLEPPELGRPSRRGLKGNKTKHNPRAESFMQRNLRWAASQEERGADSHPHRKNLSAMRCPNSGDAKM